MTQGAWRGHVRCLLPRRALLAEAGGLIYYGADVDETIARIVNFVDRILRGAGPAVLPIEQPSRFEFMVNQRTARALGLTRPANLLLRATRVIE